jgi:hypothetical protein
VQLIEGGEKQLFPALSLKGIRLIIVELHPHVIGASAVDELVAGIRRKGFVQRAVLNGEVHVFERVGPSCWSKLGGGGCSLGIHPAGAALSAM